MGIATIFTMITLAYSLYTLTQSKFYVSRTKITTTIEKDYEKVNKTVVSYFLYRNLTEDAIDNLPAISTTIVEDPSTLCPTGYQLETD